MLTRYVFHCQHCPGIKSIEIIGQEDQQMYTGYPKCPLCGHGPLTFEQSMPASQSQVYLDLKTLPRLKMDLKFLNIAGEE